MQKIALFLPRARRLVSRWAVFGLLFLVACQAVLPETGEGTRPAPAIPAATQLALANPPAGPTLDPSPAHTAPPEAPPMATPTLAPSLTPSPQPSAEASPIPSATSAPAGFQVQVHPDGGLSPGDQVSFEVIAPPEQVKEGQEIQASFPITDGEKTAKAKFGRFGIGGRLQAILLWDWDTRGLQPGEYPVRFQLLPAGLEWSQVFYLAPTSQLLPPEPSAAWARARSQCCTVHYITGSEVERDLPDLLKQIDQQAADVSQRMGVNLEAPITITLLPRVLGHGGFASSEISVSYLDRNYMSGDMDIVLHHEMVHILDGKLGGDYRPAALVEGLAVYQSGGHFKPEPITPRAAALLAPAAGCQPWSRSIQQTATGTPGPEGCGLDLYIPLQRLFDNFYFEQHEIGYLEAASLIDFMAHTWGYPAYNAFYRDIKPPQPPNGLPSQSIQAALQTHFGLTVDQLETRFKAYLQQQAPSPAQAEDLRQTLEFFDTARHYQQVLDPSAYFLNAWLLDNEQMRQKGIVADYVRRPHQPENLALETMLEAADGAMRQGDYAQSGSLLRAVETVLQAFPEQKLQAFNRDPLAADYLSLVQIVVAAGYQPERIEINNETAQVWVSQSGPQVKQLVFVRQPHGWAQQ